MQNAIKDFNGSNVVGGSNGVNIGGQVVVTNPEALIQAVDKIDEANQVKTIQETYAEYGNSNGHKFQNEFAGQCFVSVVEAPPTPAPAAPAEEVLPTLIDLLSNYKGEYHVVVAMRKDGKLFIPVLSGIANLGYPNFIEAMPEIENIKKLDVTLNPIALRVPKKMDFLAKLLNKVRFETFAATNDKFITGFFVKQHLVDELVEINIVHAAFQISGMSPTDEPKEANEVVYAKDITGEIDNPANWSK